MYLYYLLYHPFLQQIELILLLHHPNNNVKIYIKRKQKKKNAKVNKILSVSTKKKKEGLQYMSCLYKGGVCSLKI